MVFDGRLDHNRAVIEETHKVKTYDAIVIGSGPAGMALCRALATEGVTVANVSPDIDEPWPNNYGIWVDEKPDWLPDAIFEATWEQPFVRFSEGPVTLDRAYGRIDGGALRQALSVDSYDRFRGAVERVETRDDTSTVVVEGADDLQARVVFDATGSGLFLEGSDTGEVAAQTAYGVLAEVEGDPAGGESMALMDFDDSWRAADDSGPATFLYAMKLGDLWFLEETVLVERPPHPIGDLRDKLDRRMEARGVRIVRRHEEERCFIPMGTPVPSMEQQVVGFGAAAGYVHPASGYSLATSLERAPGVAKATADGLSTMAGPTLSHHIWRAVWPAENLRARRFFEFGMETLLTMDREQTMRFFDAFFELDDASWQGYLSGRLDAAGVRRVMLKLFASAGMKVRWSLATAAMGPNAARLVRALLG